MVYGRGLAGTREMEAWMLTVRSTLRIFLPQRTR